MLGILYCSLQPSDAFKGWSFSGMIMDLLHIPAYSGLTFLLVMSFRPVIVSEAKQSQFKSEDRFQPVPSNATSSPNLIINIFTFIIAVAYGILNEFIQAHVPGRDCSLWDASRNALGSGAMLALLRFLKI